MCVFINMVNKIAVMTLILNQLLLMCYALYAPAVVSAVSSSSSSSAAASCFGRCSGAYVSTVHIVCQCDDLCIERDDCCEDRIKVCDGVQGCIHWGCIRETEVCIHNRCECLPGLKRVHGLCFSVDLNCECNREDIKLMVCGADGRTYSSKCLARCIGTPVLHDGSCHDRSDLAIVSQPNNNTVTVEDIVPMDSGGKFSHLWVLWTIIGLLGCAVIVTIAALIHSWREKDRQYMQIPSIKQHSSYSTRKNTLRTLTPVSDDTAALSRNEFVSLFRERRLAMQGQNRGCSKSVLQPPNITADVVSVTWLGHSLEPLSLASKQRILDFLEKQQSIVLEEDGDTDEDNQDSSKPSILSYCSVGLSFPNANRYPRAWLPLDENRVILPCGGYINASYISESIIVTQDPLSNTLIAFWTAIWHCNVTVIAMLSDMNQRNEYPDAFPDYWPHTSDIKITCGDIDVTIISEQCIEGSVVRNFVVQRGNLMRTVIQLQLLKWGDHKNDASVPTFIIKMEEYLIDCDGTLLVHCINGADRSMLLLLVHVVLKSVLSNHKETTDVRVERKRLSKKRLGSLRDRRTSIIDASHLIARSLFLWFGIKEKAHLVATRV